MIETSLIGKSLARRRGGNLHIVSVYTMIIVGKRTSP
jgi:hypothetical protein